MSFRGREYTRSSLFQELERLELKTLPVKRYELKQYANGTVHKNSHIYFNKDKHYYSVPIPIHRQAHTYRLLRKHYRGLLQIQPYSPCTQGKERKYAYTTTKEHMPSHHHFVSEWSSEKFISWAGGIGHDCQDYIIKILDKKQHPEQSYKSCMGILQLQNKVGRTRLNNACKRALDYGAYNYNIIVNILEKGWDVIEDAPQEQSQVPNHNNIRGKDYYK